MDDDFLAELIETFLQEFDELMTLYRKSLDTLRRNKELNEARKQAFQDIFRVFHTLKGDSGYFPDFGKFTKFTTEFCEQLRPMDETVFNNPKLLKQIRINYSKLSSVLKGVQSGKSLVQFNF